MLPVSIIMTWRQNMFSLLICYAFTRNHKKYLNVHCSVMMEDIVYITCRTGVSNEYAKVDMHMLMYADIEECNQLKPCSHSCVNTVGSFRCSCPSGMSLDNSGRICRGLSSVPPFCLVCDVAFFVYCVVMSKDIQYFPATPICVLVTANDSRVSSPVIISNTLWTQTGYHHQIYFTVTTKLTIELVTIKQ